MRRCSVPGKCVGREAGHRPIWGRKCGQVVRETTLSQIFYGTSAQSRRGCPNNQLRVNGDDNRQVLWSFGGHGFVGHQLSTENPQKAQAMLGTSTVEIVARFRAVWGPGEPSSADASFTSSVAATCFDDVDAE